MQNMELEISTVGAETTLIRTIHLRAPAGESLPPFSPGAHLQVTIPGLREARCYSLISFDLDPHGFDTPAAYRLGVRLEDDSQGGSRFMHGLQAGARITVSGPKNEFPLHAAEADEPPIVLIAGGIGITPIASMATALKASGRPFVLHYSGRSRDQLAFLAELGDLAGDALVVHADDDPDTRLDLANVLDGLVTTQHLYTCGPKGMIDALIAGARQRGWADDHIHFELFTSPAPESGDTSFEVELRQSGQVLTIPANKTILEVLEEAGCDPFYDCKRGECGVCQATLIEGEADHRDYYLSEAEKAEGKLIQICVSRAKSARLVLDL